MHTIIYGYINEMDFWRDPVKQFVKEHNTAIIEALPLGDSWPPVSREMFSICQNRPDVEGPNLEYWGRIFHFGANLKEVELEWPEWRAKFEQLLGQLYFWEARVHVKAEYMDLQTTGWSVDFDKYKVEHNLELPAVPLTEHWIYEGSVWDES